MPRGIVLFLIHLSEDALERSAVLDVKEYVVPMLEVAEEPPSGLKPERAPGQSIDVVCHDLVPGSLH